MEKTIRIIRAGELSELLGISKVTLWRWERDGHFPPRKKIGPGSAVGWLSTDVEEYLKSRPNVKEEEELEK